MKFKDYVWAVLGIIVGAGRWLSARDHHQSLSFRRGVMGNEKPTMEDKQIDLLKMEYATVADRYENIYKAMWQNFSYLAVVSGGLLAFGTDSGLPLISVGAFALMPLVFWFLATYVPMDRYGSTTRTYLKKIEEDLNRLVSPNTLGHFCSFYGDNLEVNLKIKWRVRSVVIVFGLIAVISFLLLTGASIYHYWDLSFLELGIGTFFIIVVLLISVAGINEKNTSSSWKTGGILFLCAFIASLSVGVGGCLQQQLVNPKHTLPVIISDLKNTEASLRKLQIGEREEEVDSLFASVKQNLGKINEIVQEADSTD